MLNFGPNVERRDVWINDIAFSNVDDLGNRWIISDIDGWWDLPAPEVGEEERPYGEDGSYYEPGRFASRAIRLKGKIIPSSRTSNAVNIARQELNKRLMLVRKTGLLQVLESPELGRGKQSEVVIVARPLVSDSRENGTIDFDIQFRAPDPRKYSVVQEVASAFLRDISGVGRTYPFAPNRRYVGDEAANRVVAVNNGDYNTYGTIRLHGPVADPGVEHMGKGRSIKLDGIKLNTEEYVDLNLQEKTIVTSSGVSMREYMTPDSRWFDLDVGRNSLLMLGEITIKPTKIVPDASNVVTNPSFEASSGEETAKTTRINRLRDSSGMSDSSVVYTRKYHLPNNWHKNSESFSGGTFIDGIITSPKVQVVPPGAGPFNVDELLPYHFVQLDVRSKTTGDRTAQLTVDGKSTGPVAINSTGWTTLRVDSFTTSAETFTVSLDVPGTTVDNAYEVRNMHVISSLTPITGNQPYIYPPAGTGPDGVVNTYDESGAVIQYHNVPSTWKIVGKNTAKLRVVNSNSDYDGTYIMPMNLSPVIVDFGESTTYGTDITYGVDVDGLEEIRLYNAQTGDLLEKRTGGEDVYNYISKSPVKVRLEATIGVNNEGSIANRQVRGAMVTFDGGTTVFSDITPASNGYIYESFTGSAPAREYTMSYTTDKLDKSYNGNSRIVDTRSLSGSKSLEIVYNIVNDKSLPTPISTPDIDLTYGTYYARASVMSNKFVTIRMFIDGEMPVDGEQYVDVGPNSWTTVKFPVSVLQPGKVVLAVAPEGINGRNLEIYVDNVGILTEDMQYFSGDDGDEYVWTGSPNSSTSATIPLAGVPSPRMDVMYRHAWIG